MKRCRFMNNNYLINSFSVSSAQSVYVGPNLYDTSRSRFWRPAGNFEITTANRQLYINDGSDKTVTLTVGVYTFATLASHIQTRLNAESTNWTCAYNSSTTFKFTINRTSGTAILRQTVTTDSVWDTLGYTSGLDTSGGPFVADEPRNHTSEWFKCHIPVGQQATFCALLSELERVFPLSGEATIKLQASNLDDWDSPAVEVDIPIEKGAAMIDLEDIVTTSYEWYRVVFVDRRNTGGPLGFSFSYAYIGDHLSFTATNLATGFSKVLVDPSETLSSEDGSFYIDERPRYLEISSAQVQLLNGEEFDDLEQLFFDVGIRRAFLFSVDPGKEVSRRLSDLTRLMIMTQPPELAHVIRDYYNVSFSMREYI